MAELIEDYIRDNLKLVDGELYWLNKGPRGRRKTDVPAGFLMNTGYRFVKLKQKRVPYHHVIWFIYHGYFPTTKLDHVDRNPLNNSIENLRLVTDAQNCQNRRKYPDRSSLYLGVTFNKRSGKYVARIKQKNLGCFIDEKEAALAYSIAAKTLYGEYAGEVYE